MGENNRSGARVNQWTRRAKPATRSPMFRRTYDWMMERATHKGALWALALVSFIESSVFPIPPDIMLIPMVIADRTRAWLIAGVCTAASVLGGLAGYAIGYFFWEGVGEPVLDFYGKMEKFEAFRAWFTEYGFLTVFGAGLTPFPYKVITIASGVVGLNLIAFIAASILARGLRFFLVAGLLYFFGPPIRDFIEKRFALVTVALFLLIAAALLTVRFVL